MQFDEKRLNSIEIMLKQLIIESSTAEHTEEYLWIARELRNAWKELQKLYDGVEINPNVQRIDERKSYVSTLKEALDELEGLVESAKRIGEEFQDKLESKIKRPTEKLTAAIQNQLTIDERTAQKVREGEKAKKVEKIEKIDYEEDLLEENPGA
jgi:hypothetical protein